VSTAARVVAFVLGLAAAFGLALGVGRLVGPLDTEPAAHAGDDAHDAGTGTATDGADAGGDAHGDDHAEPEAAAPVLDVKGLTARQDGYTLRLADQQAAAGRPSLAFTIESSSGRPVTEFDRVHEKRLHLIVLRRDLTGYQHLHPTLDRDSGTWRTRVELTPGTWRVFADFTPTGWEALTLAEDLFVPGDFAPAPAPEDSRTDTVDGYEVTLAGDTAPGTDTLLGLRVTRDGEPVTDLQPYLGAHGHLVAIRAGDLGYLHVHPEEDGSSGPEVEFATSFPTHGTYRLFFDFKHGDEVRTADFTVDASGTPGGTSGGTDEGAEDPDDSHGGDDHGH
jgi:hypothetical protein